MANVPVASATHTQNCLEATVQNRFAAWGKLAANVAGADARIQNETLNFCTSATDNDRGNQIWSAVDRNGTYTQTIVQTGLIQCSLSGPACDDTLNEARAWGRNSAAPGCGGFITVEPVPIRLGDPPGLQNYEVVRTAAEWRFIIGGVVHDTLPLGSICWTPSRAIWFGESWDSGDAIGGFAGNHVSLTNALYEPSVGGAWNSPSFNPGANCPIIDLAKYKCVAQNGQAIDFWTVQ